MRPDPVKQAEQAEQAGRRLHRFPGGLRLRHNKAVSCERPVARVGLPPRLFVPVPARAGEPAEVLVMAGDTVRKGDPIVRATRRSGWIHAPTSGSVEAVTDHPVSHPSGRDGPCVVIAPDGLDQWTDLDPLQDWQQADPAELRKRIREAGIVGLGGAVFPTSVKMDEASRKGIHTLILNGAECEPYISCDEMLMRERPASIVLGARILQRAIGARRTVIAIEDPMAAVRRALEAALKEAAAGEIDIVQVPAIYPEGGEKQLVQVLTGLEVPSGGRPTDLGLLCQNVATADAAARAVTEGKPLVERIVTVTGNGVRHPQNLLAAIGTPISALIDQCGGYAPEAARLVLGGPMMGYPLATDANPVVKAANCILVMTGSDLRPAQPEMPCIRCGECARACPAMLLPQQLVWTVRNGLWEGAADSGLSDCIECGCCDFVCPSHIPLVSWFRHGKLEQRRRAEERRRADLARERFEAREGRLERNKQERRQRMAEKKRGLSDARTRRAEIDAAVERAKQRSRGEDSS